MLYVESLCVMGIADLIYHERDDVVPTTSVRTSFVVMGRRVIYLTMTQSLDSQLVVRVVASVDSRKLK